MRQKDEIELVIRSSQPACLYEGLFCFVLAALCVFCARMCASLRLLSPTLRLLTMANAPVCLRGVVSQKQQHIQERLVLSGFVEGTCSN